MTTTPAPSTTSIPMDAVQIGDTIASLQGLVTAYGHVLEQAKAQLEQLELTPDQLRTMQLWLKDNANYSRIADQLADNILYVTDSNDSIESLRYRRLIETITERVTQRIADATLNRFRDEIHSLVTQERIDAQERFERLTREQMESDERRLMNDLRIENRNLKQTLRQVLNLAFDDSELYALASQAMAEPTTTSTDSANA